jgi:hypothetical protein
MVIVYGFCDMYFAYIVRINCKKCRYCELRGLKVEEGLVSKYGPEEGNASTNAFDSER